MNTDQRNTGSDNDAERGKGAPASRAMRNDRPPCEIRNGVVVMWWGFFDWVAVV